MEITISQKQGRVAVTVLHIKGVIDSSTYQAFTDAMRQALDGGAQYLLLDLAGVPFISSAGIRSLNELSLLLRKKFPPQEADRRSRHLKLLSPSDRITDILKMSGVDMFFETYTDLGQAVASF